MDKIKAFAPATIANIGPGFDVLGLAITGLGDYVEAKKSEEPGIRITEITGLKNDIPLDAYKNTAGIASMEVLKLLNVADNEGIELRLRKNLPSGSGLGSSAASAAAAAYAVNALFGGKLTKNDLIMPATIAEESVSGGFFANNTAPSLLGGATLTRCRLPLNAIKLCGTMDELVVVVAAPKYRLLTKTSREALPKTVPMESFVNNMANACLMVSAFNNNDVELFGRCVNDEIVEPARAGLIPGFYDVKKSALEAGAYGCSISGAGPSVFALTDREDAGRSIGKAMQDAFGKNGLASVIYVSKVDNAGAREEDG